MKNRFVVRRANLKDLRDILKLNFDLFKKEYREFDKSLDLKWTYGKKGKKYFRNRITKRNGFVEVAENNGKIIGYICGGVNKRFPYRIEAKYAELENIFIEKKFRNKGLGGKMIKDFLKWCKKNKIDYVSVIASAKNKSAINFYRKQGLKDHDLALERKLKN